MNSVSKQIASSLVYTDCVKDIWDQLKRRYHQVTGSRIYQLRKDLVTTHQGMLSVEVYYAKLTSIWQELVEYRPLNQCTCAGLKILIEYLDSKFVMTFLMGLNESYSAIRAQILLKNLLPSIDEVFNMIIHEEHQRTLNQVIGPLESVALVAPVDHSKRSFNTDRFKRMDSQRPVCTHCGLKGHTIDPCFKLHGYPSGYRSNTYSKQNSGEFVRPSAPSSNFHGNKQNQSAFFASLNTDQYSSLMSMLQSHMPSSSTSSEKPSDAGHVAGTCLSIHQLNIPDAWYIDSGASSHICHDKSLFVSLKSVDNVSITLPNQMRFSVELFGDVQLTEDFILTDVLFVPGFFITSFPSVLCYVIIVTQYIFLPILVKFRTSPT